MKLCIVSKREYSFLGRDGKQVEGVMYGAITPENDVLEFSSRRKDHEVQKELMEYDEAKSVVIGLNTRIGDGKLKYSEMEDK